MTAKPAFRRETFIGPPTSLSFILVFPTDPGIKTLVVVLASESGGTGSAGESHSIGIRSEKNFTLVKTIL